MCWAVSCCFRDLTQIYPDEIAPHVFKQTSLNVAVLIKKNIRFSSFLWAARANCSFLSLNSVDSVSFDGTDTFSGVLRPGFAQGRHFPSTRSPFKFPAFGIKTNQVNFKKRQLFKCHLNLCFPERGRWRSLSLVISVWTDDHVLMTNFGSNCCRAFFYLVTWAFVGEMGCKTVFFCNDGVISPARYLRLSPHRAAGTTTAELLNKQRWQTSYRCSASCSLRPLQESYTHWIGCKVHQDWTAAWFSISRWSMEPFPGRTVYDVIS